MVRSQGLREKGRFRPTERPADLSLICLVSRDYRTVVGPKVELNNSSPNNNRYCCNSKAPSCYLKARMMSGSIRLLLWLTTMLVDSAVLMRRPYPIPSQPPRCPFVNVAGQLAASAER